MTTSSPPAFISNRYRLIEWLGRGAMGMVYRARDETLERTVVIKFLSNLENSSYEQRQRFLREARTVARLSHPNIMAIFDSGEQEGWNYLVLEDIPGGDLNRFRRQHGGKVPIPETLRLLHQTLDALSYAHEHEVVHRDIKPENILLTTQNQVKVADFGLALGRDDARLTQSGAIVGTALYLAPETLSGGGNDARSDIYSLGAVTYELLTGRAPFEGDHIMAVVAQMVSGDFPNPRALNPHISPEVEGILLRMLAREPSLRYASAKEIITSLDELEHQATISESSPGLILLGGSSDVSSALEDERRRLGGQVHSSIIEPLNLLLAQVAAFEQSLSNQPSARMAVSILGTLARQTLQQARDIEASLNPAMLESLGLEPALELLAERLNRTHAMQTRLEVSRLTSRLPNQQELLVFRLAQEFLEQLASQHASLATINLYQDAGKVILELVYPTGLLQQTIIDQAQKRLKTNGVRLEQTQPSPESACLAIFLPVVSEVSDLFTEREIEVLQCLVEGLENKEIANRLTISPRTVAYHLDNIFSKLDVRTRTEAAIIAIRRGYARRPSQTT